MSKGNPPIPVRMSPEHRDRWQAAAAKAGMDFTTWVRSTLDLAAGFTPGGHARVPTSDTPAACPPHRLKHGGSGLLVCADCGAVNPVTT